MDLATLGLVSDDVNWPGNEKRVHGKAALRTYWLNEWAEIHPHDPPAGLRTG